MATAWDLSRYGISSAGWNPSYRLSSVGAAALALLGALTCSRTDATGTVPPESTSGTRLASSTPPPPPRAARGAALHWGLDRIDQRELPLDGSTLPRGLGRGVNVYVIDTGVSPEVLQLTRLPAEHSGDFVGDAWGKQHGSADCQGHGSHVAGIVAGAETGVASGVTLRALRVTDCEGRGKPEVLTAAMDWLAENRQLPAVALFSVQYRDAPIVEHAAARLHARGVVVVAAAGGR